MYVLKNDLYHDLCGFSRIFIYGAGNYAKKAYELLKSTGLKEKIYSFVVTEAEEWKDIDGIQVRRLSGLVSLFDKDSIVLIAVSRTYEDEIVQILKSTDSVYAIRFTDYMIQEYDFHAMLKEQSDEKFVESILGGCMWDGVGSMHEFAKETVGIGQEKPEHIDKNMIVYISGYLNPRSDKMIGALVKKNFHVIVLEYGLLNEMVRTGIMTYNVEFFHCRDIGEVFYIALQYKPLVYYFEPEWGLCIGSEIMIRHKDVFGKIVFAAYDVVNDGYVDIRDSDKLSERYCMENADGIVWRWFSKEYLEEKKGFVYKGKSIQFPDYCKGFEIEKSEKSDDKLKLCFVQGGIYKLLNETPSIDKDTYKEPANLDVILNKIGNISGCTFHLYLGRCSDSDKKKLEELEKEYANFKVFYGVEYNELIYRISGYDYGVFLVTGRKDIPELQSIDNIYYGSIYVNSIANRFLDYLDANIPVIGTLPKKQCEFLEKYGVIVKMDLSNLNIEYLKKNKKLYKKNVEKVKTELLIDNHIQRLVDWFNEL